MTINLDETVKQGFSILLPLSLMFKSLVAQIGFSKHLPKMFTMAYKSFISTVKLFDLP